MKISTLFILIALSNNLYSQKTSLDLPLADYKITYLLTYQPNLNNPNNLQTEEMYLYLAKNASKFGSAGKILGDSIMQSRNDEDNKSQSNFSRLMSNIPDTQFNYVIYKGLPQNKMTFTQNIFKDEFIYETEKDLFKWQIYPETKNYEGLKIQKATTYFAGRQYEAWFTSEIPFSDGPYKFNGLPGLIVKISDQRDQYVFELKEIKKLLNKIIVKIPQKSFIETDKDKLTQLIQQDKEDPLRAMESAGVSIGFTKEQKRELRESKMKRNNPIELE